MARLLAVIPLAITAVLAGRAVAHEQFYVAALSGAAEMPANDSPGLGAVVVTVNLDLATLRVQAQFSGLDGQVLAAHIHGGTDFPLQGLANPATQLPTFSGFPSGVTSGSYDAAFSLAQAATYNPAFINAAGGTIDDAYNDFVQSLNSATMYFNIHTTAWQGGEIRGFLLPTPSADFDRNGHVDQADLIPWAAAPRVDSSGDANADSQSDGADFLVWQNQFGAVAGIDSPGHGHVSTVPEPAADAAAWLALGAFGTRKYAVFLRKRLPIGPPSVKMTPLSRFSTDRVECRHVVPDISSLVSHRRETP